jgi:nitrous oxide reductase accessory protein NosL
VKTSALLSTLIAFSALAACAPVEGGGSATPPPPSSELGQCKADAYRSYIGKNRSELPAAPASETRREVCTTCAMTMDFNPNRVNIVYDANSNLITQVKCG